MFLYLRASVDGCSVSFFCGSYSKLLSFVAPVANLKLESALPLFYLVLSAADTYI